MKVEEEISDHKSDGFQISERSQKFVNIKSLSLSLKLFLCYYFDQCGELCKFL